MLNLIMTDMPVRGMTDEQLTRAVNELLRYGSSVQADARAALRDTILGGAHIAQGDEVILLHGAIDRDPKVFSNADDLVLDRVDNPHMAFGRGIHACPGAPFVMQWTRGVIKSFLSYPSLRLAAEPRWLANASIRGLAELRVVKAPR